MLHRLRLRLKIQLVFLCIGLATAAITGWQAYETGRSALEEITFQRMVAIREIKRKQVENRFTLLRDQVSSVAQSATAKEALSAFGREFPVLEAKQAGADSLLRCWYLSPPYAGTPEYASLSASVANYDRVHSEFDPWFRTLAKRFGFEDLYLIDGATGIIVYSAQKHADYGRRINERFFAGTGLSAVQNEAASSKDPDFVWMGDFAPYGPADGEPAAFIAAPVIDDRSNKGTIVVRLSVAIINDVMTSQRNWEREGLGKTGEVYIVGSDGALRTDSRFFIQDPRRYYQRLRASGVPQSTIDSISQLETSILIQSVHTEASRDALAGGTNTRIVTDYRSVPVVSSYTPLTVPNVRWAVLAEIDTEEAFAPIVELRQRLIGVTLAVALAAMILGFIVSRMITAPLGVLTSAVDGFGKGDLERRIAVPVDEEFGAMAATFNVMADNLKEHSDQLRKEIDERKLAEEKLQQSHERLRSLSTHLQTLREEERKSVAREIHDELGQALTALKMDASHLARRIPESDTHARDTAREMISIIEDTITSVKRITTALRPGVLDDLGLAAAVEWQAEEFEKRTGIACDLLISPPDIVESPDLSTAVFRIFQEALTNVARHANAAAVEARLIRDEVSLELSVSDDGVGIPEEKIADSESFGLLGIRERTLAFGGTVRIVGHPDKGTTVTALFPCMNGKGGA